MTFRVAAHHWESSSNSIKGKFKTLDIFMGTFVEENIRAALTLKVNAINLFVWHLHDFDLNFGHLEDRHCRGLLLAVITVDLIFDFKV